MKIQELNHSEMQEVNGGGLLDGLLGGGSGSNNLLANLVNNLGLNLNFSRATSSHNADGSSNTSRTQFSLGANLLSGLLGNS